MEVEEYPIWYMWVALAQFFLGQRQSAGGDATPSYNRISYTALYDLLVDQVDDVLFALLTKAVNIYM
jgi:hypothetical protein